MEHSDARMANLCSKGLDEYRGLHYFLAQTPLQRESIFRLRYEAYLKEGIISPRNEERLSDEYDFEAAFCSFGVTLDRRLVSTIRLTLLNAENCSSIAYSLCKEDIVPLLGRGETVAEVTRLAVNITNRAVRRRVILYTLKIADVFFATSRADRAAIVVRESHKPFYKRYGFQCVRGSLSYQIHEPLCLMIMNLEKPRSALHDLAQQPLSSGVISRPNFPLVMTG